MEYRLVYLFRNVMVRVDAEGLRSRWKGGGVGVVWGRNFKRHIIFDCYLFFNIVWYIFWNHGFQARNIVEYTIQISLTIDRFLIRFSIFFLSTRVEYHNYSVSNFVFLIYRGLRHKIWWKIVQRRFYLRNFKRSYFKRGLACVL